MKAITFPNWQIVRKGIDEVYEKLGKPKPSNIPGLVWNFFGWGMEYQRKLDLYTCMECNRKIAYHKEIRCLDCSMIMCKICAERHFYPPNGRRDYMHKHMNEKLYEDDQ